MTGKEEIFNLIKDVVEAQGYFKEYDLYYNQFDDEVGGQGKILQKPALLVEFGDIQWASQVGGLQKGDTVLTFHMGRKWMRREPSKVFEMETKLMEALHLVDDYRVNFERISESQNTNFGKMAVWTVSFGCIIYDESGCPPTTKKETATDLEIERDIVASIDGLQFGGFNYSFNFDI